MIPEKSLLNSKVVKDFNGQINVPLTVQLWIFAECGIGGVMHGLHIPFTGIVVGSLAIYCIYLLALSQSNIKDIRKTIASATITVLLIKMLLTPFAPIQAYIATAFQGIMGYVIFSLARGKSWNLLFMAFICLGESAIQKVLISYFLFGTAFFEAIDMASINIFNNVGLEFKGSLTVFVWSVYIGLHLITAVLIGSFIPKTLDTLQFFVKYKTINVTTIMLDESNVTEVRPWHRIAIKSFWLGLILLALVLLGTLYFVGSLGILFRFVLFSILLTLSGKVFSTYFMKKNTNNTSFSTHQEIAQIWQTGKRITAIYHWSRSEYAGWIRWKNFFMGVLAIPFSIENSV